MKWDLHPPFTAFTVVGYSQWSELYELIEDYEPIVSSSRNLVFRSIYMALATCCLLLLLHVMGTLLFYYLNIRKKLPLRTRYVSSEPPSHLLLNNVTIVTQEPKRKESETESEDLDAASGFATYISRSDRQQKRVAGQHEQSFFETKV